MSVPEILFISSAWPASRGFGGQVRAFNTATALRDVGAVSVMVVSDDPYSVQLDQCGPDLFRFHEPVVPQLAPPRGILAKMAKEFDSQSMSAHGISAPRECQERLECLIRSYDLVWVLNSRTPNILRRWRWDDAHLDIDDIPSTYHRSVSISSNNIVLRCKSRIRQHLGMRREMRLKERFSTLSVCSDDDRRYLGGGAHIHVIPNGFARPPEEPVRAVAVETPRIGFIGLYDYEPNREGVQWFVGSCWPAIEAAIPGVRFRLLGKGTDGPDGPKHGSVDALGFVEDSAAEIATWSAMVIPIRLGGGTRIKVADAFSRKCPVISTSLGAYGYGVDDGKQLRLADTPEQFAAACIDVIRNRAEADAMAERAYQEFLEKWTWDAIAPRVWAAAEDCLRRSRDQGRGRDRDRVTE